MNCGVWHPQILAWLDIGYCRTRKAVLAGQQHKNDVKQQLLTKVFWKVLDLVRELQPTIFWEGF